MANTLKTEFTQEVRFAVVMYGGSSLAIYMNGVAQELLRLVRAAAEKTGSAVEGLEGEAYLPEVKGSERIYRKLGQMLSNPILAVRGAPFPGVSLMVTHHHRGLTPDVSFQQPPQKKRKHRRPSRILSRLRKIKW